MSYIESDNILRKFWCFARSNPLVSPSAIMASVLTYEISTSPSLTNLHNQKYLTPTWWVEGLNCPFSRLAIQA